MVAIFVLLLIWSDKYKVTLEMDLSPLDQSGLYFTCLTVNISDMTLVAILDVCKWDM